ncbi:MAG: YfhO family protein [Myxococcota bacterium]
MNSSSSPNPKASRRATIGAALGIAGLIAAAFAPVLIGGQSFYHLDTYFEHVPFWHFAAQTVANGEWPWWTPNIRAGYPLHANGEASLLYPLTLPFGLALPAHRAIDGFVVLHLVALGVFTYRYLCELEVPPVLALVGGVAFSLSGRMVASTIWPNAVAASCFLPLLLLGIERCRRPDSRGALVVAAAVGLGLLSGRPQRFVPALMFAGAYTAVIALYVGRRDGSRHGWGVLLRAGAATLLGLAIAAPQVLPTLSLLGDSVWSEGVSRKVFELNSLHGKSLASIALPAGARVWAEGKMYPGWFVYLGIAAGILGLAAGMRGRTRGKLYRDPRALFFLGSIVVCLWLALAGPFAYEISSATPVVKSLRSPVRFLFPAAFAAVAFAALAYRDALSRWTIPRGAVLTAAALACAELVVICWRTAPTGPSAIYEVQPEVIALFPDDALDPSGFRYRFYASGHWVAPGAVESTPERELAARFAALPLTRDLPMRFGGLSSTGYGEPRLAWKVSSYKRLVRNEIDQLGVKRLFMSHRLKWGGYEFVRRQGVSFLYTNPTPMPRAVCVSQLVSAADAEHALAHAADPAFDPRVAAVVERNVEPSPDSTGHTVCEVHALQASPTRISLESRSTEPSWLVLFDTWAPGWSARVNDTPVPIERANGMFRVVTIPAGTAIIEFRYLPPRLLLGGAVAAVGIVTWLALLFTGYRTRREAGA